MAKRKFRKGEKLGPKGKLVMGEFGKGKLRSSSGKTVTNQKQALAIAFSEQRAGKKRGWKKRQWAGRTRLRPNRKRFLA